MKKSNKRICFFSFNYTVPAFISLILTLCIVFSGCSQSTQVSTQLETTAISDSNSNDDASKSDIEETNGNNEKETNEADTENATETETVPETTTELNYDKLIDFEAEHPYMIRINRAQNWTVIYGMDKEGRYSVPYKIFLCSTGLNEGDTPLGSYTLGQKYDWRLMVDGSYAQYAIRIHGPIMLHSVPYYSQNKDDLEVKEYKKLGQPASLGCIRYTVEDIKWIYDNCPDGTIVVIYDSIEEKPLLEIPEITPAKSKGKKAGWDPTDPDKNNPWNKTSKKKVESSTEADTIAE